MTYASITDVSTRLGRPIVDTLEVAQVNAWLEDVEAIILARIPGLPDAVIAGSPTAATVVMVESNAVIRKIKNPDGKVAERVDDYDYRLNENSRKGELFLTDEEWALLTPDGPDGAFTIRPWRDLSGCGWWVHPDVWVPEP